MKWNKIVNAFGNIDQILEGVKNKIFKRQDVEDIADARWTYCSMCPSLDTVGHSCAVKNTQPCCTDCGCSLGLKLRALSSSCPQKKWGAVTDAESEKAIKEQIKESSYKEFTSKKINKRCQ